EARKQARRVIDQSMAGARVLPNRRHLTDRATWSRVGLSRVSQTTQSRTGVDNNTVMLAAIDSVSSAFSKLENQ
ncbi:hypothetical protein OS493_038549, partial [Desmophyllum pertusum]